jgi:hypothetical protein
MTAPVAGSPVREDSGPRAYARVNRLDNGLTLGWGSVTGLILLLTTKPNNANARPGIREPRMSEVNTIHDQVFGAVTMASWVPGRMLILLGSYCKSVVLI